MLLSFTVALLCLLASFGLLCCALNRQWGTLAFVTVVYASVAAILIYGAGHTPVG